MITHNHAHCSNTHHLKGWKQLGLTDGVTRTLHTSSCYQSKIRVCVCALLDVDFSWGTLRKAGARCKGHKDCEIFANHLQSWSITHVYFLKFSWLSAGKTIVTPKKSRMERARALGKKRANGPEVCEFLSVCNVSISSVTYSQPKDVLGMQRMVC